MRQSTTRIALLVACLSLLAVAPAHAAAPPTVATGTNTFDGHGGTIVRSYVNPNGSAVTSCVFEYGLTQGYGQSVACEQSPGSGEAVVEVTVDLAGLQPGAIYHFAVSASNGEGAKSSEDGVFVAPAAVQEPSSCPNAGMPGLGFLPECRGWEMVSRPEKGGGDVIGAPYRVRTAVDGSAATYSSLIATDDALGTGVAAEYMSERTAAPGTQGWSAHPITPAQPPGSLEMATSLGVETNFRGEFSSDLGTGVLRAWSPLSEDPNVANVANLYLRSDLLSSGAGEYQLLTACPACLSPFPASDLHYKPTFIWASQDLKHVLFESELPLTEGTSGIARRLYEWDEGTVRLAGISPGGSALSSSEAGGGGSYLNTLLGQRSISADGSKVFFSSLAGGGKTVGQLYMRTNASETVRLNKSERTPPDTNKPAQFYDATADGSRVFFTSTEALTNDAPVDGNAKLYMYDTTKPDSDPHNLTYLSGTATVPSTDVVGVIGTSADGSTVYFIASPQLVAGGPSLASGLGIFVWHEGTISFVAGLHIGQDGQLTRAAGVPRQASVSENGDLVFSLYDPIGPTGYDHGICAGVPENGFGHCREVYLYRLATRSLNCVSCNPSGAPGTSNAAIYTESGLGGSNSNVREARSISADGSKVFFSTGDALVAQDTNEARDVYEYDSASGALHLISSGTDPNDSYFMGSTPDGQDAFFITRARLVGWDFDGAYDLYDARAGGGFPEPPPVPAACAEESCHHAYPLSPVLGAPVSATVTGPGNPPASVTGAGKPKPAARCAKGRRLVRRHGKLRCVKPQRKHGNKRRAGR